MLPAYCNNAHENVHSNNFINCRKTRANLSLEWWEQRQQKSLVIFLHLQKLYPIKCCKIYNFCEFFFYGEIHRITNYPVQKYNDGKQREIRKWIMESICMCVMYKYYCRYLQRSIYFYCRAKHISVFKISANTLFKEIDFSITKLKYWNIHSSGRALSISSSI